MKLFITGTDTGIGKTYITASLLRYFAAQGKSTVALKPIASGCELLAGALRNEDALVLQKNASVKLPYEEVNPFAFQEPIAPHLAAKKLGVEITAQKIVSHVAEVEKNYPSDVLLIEGVGGWLVPLNESETLAELAKSLNFPVLLVVGMRLGCLNHALLTAAAMRQENIPLMGWIANCLDSDMLALEANIATLRDRIDAPCLAVVGRGEELSLSQQLQRHLCQSFADTEAEIFFGCTE